MKTHEETKKRRVMTDLLYNISGSVLYAAGIYTFADNDAPAEYSAGRNQLQGGRKTAPGQKRGHNGNFLSVSGSCVPLIPDVQRRPSDCISLLGRLSWGGDGSVLSTRFFVRRD